MKVWDVHSYFNEDEIAHVRAKELAPVVTHRVVIESDHTFSYKYKGFNYPADLAKDVRWIKLKSPENLRNWEFENWQTEQIALHMTDVEDDDVVIYSDCDEVACAKRIQKIIDQKLLYAEPEQTLRLDTIFMMFRFNLMWMWRDWSMAAVTTGKQFRKMGACFMRKGDYQARVLRHSGWHLYAIGGDDALVQKAKHCSHCGDPDCVEMVRRIESGVSEEKKLMPHLAVIPDACLPAGALDYPHLIHRP